MVSECSKSIHDTPPPRFARWLRETLPFAEGPPFAAWRPRSRENSARHLEAWRHHGCTLVRLRLWTKPCDRGASNADSDYLVGFKLDSV